MSDQEIEEAILTRFVIKESSINKCMKNFVLMCEAIKNGTTTEGEASYNEILKELDFYEFSIAKTELTVEAYEGDKKNYEKLFQLKEQQIAKVVLEIQELKEQLEREKQERKYKEEYEALAKIINAFPTRESSEKEIAKLNEELRELEGGGSSIQLQFEVRSKQLQLLLFSVDELQRELEEERVKKEAEERERKAKEQQEAEQQEAKQAAEQQEAEQQAAEQEQQAEHETEQQENEPNQSDQQDIEPIEKMDIENKPQKK